MKKIQIKNMETILTVVIIAVFLLWFMRRCASPSHDQMQPIQKNTDTLSAPSPAGTNHPATPNAPPTRVDTIVTTQTVTLPAVMYVWTDSLKVRTDPYLNSPVVAKLPINTTLTFLNEVSSFKQKISIDGVGYNDPWIKVKTPTGTVGWVYGGGVRMYRK